MTGMNDTADMEGFIAAYPNGTGLLADRLLTWNVLFGFGYASRNNVDDVTFARTLIEELELDYAIDRNRIYATGISNGGMFTYLLGSRLSDVLAAIAPVAGSIGASPGAGADFITFPPPKNPVSVMAFHGRQDKNVPYEGGQGTGLSKAVYRPVSYSVDAWVKWDGCSNTPVTTTSPNGNVMTQTYTGGRNGAEVALVTVNNGGHSWPGGKRYTGGTEPARDLSANEMMWRFFSRHPKR